MATAPLHDYYKLSRNPVTGAPLLSNSWIKQVYNELTGKPDNLAGKKAAFQFGQAFHTLLLEDAEYDNSMLLSVKKRLLLIRMVEATREQLGEDFFKMARHEREFYAKFLGHWWKSKIDWFYQPGPTHTLTLVPIQEEFLTSYYYEERIVTDFKTTGARDERDCLRDAYEYGYDVQVFVYLNTAKAGQMSLIFVPKAAPHELIHLAGIDRYHDLYKSGQVKVIKYLEALTAANIL